MSVSNKLALVPCPLCNNREKFLPVEIPDGDPHIGDYGNIYAGMEKSEWKVCGSCGFLHQNPRPPAETLNEFYAESKYHRTPKVPSVNVIQKEYRGVYGPDIDFIAKTIPELFRTKGRVFDVGCGYGMALKDFKDLGFEVYGVEPDEHRAKFATKELGLSNVKLGLMKGDIEFEGNVDLIFSHHTFEHIADFKEVFAGINKVTREGGYFFASVPTYNENRSVMSKLYLNAGHYSSFSHKAFARLLGKHGFTYVAHCYFNGRGASLTDDVMIIAQKTAAPPANLDAFKEDPIAVQHYVNYENPRRSRLYSPLYSIKYKYLGKFLKRLAHRSTYLWHPILLRDKIKEKLQ